MSTASNALKLATVFGAGSTLTATYTKGKVAYSDGKSKLEFDVAGDAAKDEGIYDVKVVSETEIVETFKSALKAEAKAGAKTGTSTAKQSPAYGFQQRQPK